VRRGNAGRGREQEKEQLRTDSPIFLKEKQSNQGTKKEHIFLKIKEKIVTIYFIKYKI
jgi:hypothetical protein